MKFLFDECLSPELVKLAHAKGYGESSHVVWLGRAGEHDWDLMPFILDRDWTFVTMNSVDFRGPRNKRGSKGQYAKVQIHAGLICLNGPVSTNLAMQIWLFQQVLHELEADPDMVNSVLEITWQDDDFYIERYKLPDGLKSLRVNLGVRDPGLASRVCMRSCLLAAGGLGDNARSRCCENCGEFARIGLAQGGCPASCGCCSGGALPCRVAGPRVRDFAIYDLSFPVGAASWGAWRLRAEMGCCRRQARSARHEARGLTRCFGDFYAARDSLFQFPAARSSACSVPTVPASRPPSRFKML